MYTSSPVNSQGEGDRESRTPAAGSRTRLIILTECGSLLLMGDNPKPETRRSERHEIRMALVLVTNPNDVEEQEETFAVDISQHGCRIQGAASLVPGQLIHLIPSESSTAAMSGRVVWVGEPASALAGEAGIEFLQPISSPV